MNKRFHRIVFNRARGQRMAVQESASSAGKATGATSALVVAFALSLVPSVALVASVVTAALAGASANAQIVAAPGAPAALRPTIVVTPNNVPVVNIQTPSAAGVSRNLYNQFDIQRNGAILNNSRNGAQTQLGGAVQANPWLATGPARVILNEITSGNPTQIRGALEVAGQRAEVIVANPAGIAVDGGAFINASRATLTTGTPQFNATGTDVADWVRGRIVGDKSDPTNPGEEPLSKIAMGWAMGNSASAQGVLGASVMALGGVIKAGAKVAGNAGVAGTNIEANGTRRNLGANGEVTPTGFANANEFANFGVKVREGLKTAGYRDVEPILQGSAVTGKSFATGAPFDVGRISDFDVALASSSLLRRAQELGIGVRSGGTRTGPLSARDLEALGLTKFASDVGAQAGREVNFMIYQSSAVTVQRAPSISLPNGKR